MSIPSDSNTERMRIAFRVLFHCPFAPLSLDLCSDSLSLSLLCMFVNPSNPELSTDQLFLSSLFPFFLSHSICFLQPLNMSILEQLSLPLALQFIPLLYSSLFLFQTFSLPEFSPSFFLPEFFLSISDFPIPA